MTRKVIDVTRLATVTTIVLLLFVGSSRVSASDPPSPASAQITIDNFTFGPQELTIPVGTTVTWTNRDDIPHTVVSTDGVFKSKVRDTDETFSFTFAKPGSYSYYCSVHPRMTGKVIVH